MEKDRFNNFDPDVRELVLAFEKQQDGGIRYFDVDQIEIIADYYLEVYDVEGLKAVVECGEQLFPGSDAVRLRRANLFSVQGEYGKALAILLDLEKNNPGNTDVSYALGALYSMTDKPLKAIDYYLKAAADGYELDMIYGNIGDEYYKLGNPDEAVRYYRMSIAKNANEERSLYNLACAWDEQGRSDESVDFFTQHVSDHPYSKGGWYCLACVYAWLSLYEKSADAYEYAIAIDATMFNAYIGLADCYSKLGNMPRAVQTLRDALDYAGENVADVYYEIGRLYFEKGNYHTASLYFHEAIKSDPTFSVAWNDLGRCCAQIGYADEAASYFRRAIDLEPDADEHWICLADLYIHTQRYSEACALLESSRPDAKDLFCFDERLVYCYYKLGRRNRLFDLLHHDAARVGQLYPSLLSQYPELAADAEIVDCINMYNR